MINKKAVATAKEPKTHKRKIKKNDLDRNFLEIKVKKALDAPISIKDIKADKLANKKAKVP